MNPKYQKNHWILMYQMYPPYRWYLLFQNYLVLQRYQKNH
jgi:hypothetical protein